MKRLACVVLACVLLLIQSSNVFALDPDISNMAKAERLKSLGLFLGSDKGFELERAPTRAEVAVMLVRLLGKEEQALSGSQEHPFKDVPGWASPYISYMFQNGLTQGISKTDFGSEAPAEAGQYVTFLLRALGYSDQKGEFKYEHCLDFAWDMGIITTEEFLSLKTKKFLRADVAGLSYDALSAPMNNSPKRLSNKLLEEGVFSPEVAESGGIDTRDDFYVVEDYGPINDLPFFGGITVGVDSMHGGKFTAVGKHLRFKVDRESLPPAMKGYTKINRTEVYGNPDVKKIEAAINAMKAEGRFSDEASYGHDDLGNALIHGGRCNALVFMIGDRSGKPLGYSVVRFLGFKDFEEDQDVTYRYEAVDVGDVEGAGFFNQLIVFNRGMGMQIRINQKELPASMKGFTKIRVSGFGQWPEENAIADTIKRPIEGDYNDYSFKDDLGGSVYSFGPVNIITIGDKSGKVLGYCILRERINTMSVR